MSWLETYRGTVNRWEVDNVDHFTVAYYFERFEDATLALRHALGLDPVSLARAGCACASKEFHVRYLRELRIGDILHIRSGVIAIVDDGLVLGHQVFDSGDGALCTTAALRMALIDGRRRAPVPLTPDQRGAAESLLIEWDPPAPATAVTLPEAGNDNGFLDTSRDAIKPWEADALGEADFPAYIHRFSAANAQLLAAFGVTPAYMRAEGRGLSTFEFRLRFPGSLRAGDLVRVQSGLAHVGNSSMRILHRMENALTGETVAILEQSGVHLDTVERRPTPLPDAFRERARSLLIRPAAGQTA